MALVNCNTYPVISGSIVLPRVGVWSADLVVDQVGDNTFTSGTKVTIESSDITLSGVVVPDRAGDFLDAKHIRVVGGAGGMATMASAKSYVQPSAFVRDVVNGLLSDAGETLSDSAEQSLLGTNLTAWSVFADVNVSTALKILLDIVAPTATWRITTDGKVFLGSESWPSASGSYELIDADPKEGTYLLGIESPWVIPGTEIADIGKVARVEHTIEPARIRSKVWVLLPEGDRGIAAAVKGIVSQETAHIDYYGKYEAKVVSQSADKATVDLQPTDSRLSGLQHVPLRHGVPGMTVQVQPDSYVLLGWDGGDPQKPYAALWKGDASAIQLNLKATTIVLNDGTNHVARVGDSTNGHVHVESGNAGPYPIVGSTQQATDTIAENGGTVKCG